MAEAFLYSESIDVTTYGRQRDRLREELTLAKIDHHAEAVEELDVEGILAFAERILPRASDLWVQASLDYKQRLQQLFFPEGIAFDGNRFNRTAVTAPLFKYLAASESAEESLVSLTGIEPVSDYPRKVVHRRGNSTGRLVVRNCAPDCALTGVYPRQTPSLTRRHGERPLGGQVVETTAENVIRYVSTLLQRCAFQACSIDHSDISPFRIKHLRTASSKNRCTIHRGSSHPDSASRSAGRSRGRSPR